MSRVPGGFRLEPGKESEHLLHELLLAELQEHRLRGWRLRVVILFVATSGLVFLLARWPNRFGAHQHALLLSGWLFSAMLLAAVSLMTWHAESRRRRILRRMEHQR